MQEMSMQDLRCACVACVARSIGLVVDDERRQRLLDALRAVGRLEDEIDALEWWMEYENTPIDLGDIPQRHEPLFWDVLGLLMWDVDRHSYTKAGCVITLGGGKFAIQHSARNDQQRCEYTCVARLRADYESGDSVATEGVQLAEQLLYYLHADREQYECLCATDLRLRIEIDYEKEVVYIERAGEISEIYEYTLDEFIALVGVDPLVTEAVDLLEDVYPDLDWRPS